MFSLILHSSHTHYTYDLQQKVNKGRLKDQNRHGRDGWRSFFLYGISQVKLGCCQLLNRAIRFAQWLSDWLYAFVQHTGVSSLGVGARDMHVNCIGDTVESLVWVFLYVYK